MIFVFRRQREPHVGRLRASSLAAACSALIFAVPVVALAHTGNSLKTSDVSAAGKAPLKPLLRVAPVYPRMAQLSNYEGVVEVCFTVTAQGAVADLKREGYPKLVAPAGPLAPASATARKAEARKLLGNAAAEAVQKWRFAPGRRKGKAVATHGVCQEIDFKLSKPRLTKTLKDMQKAAAAGSAIAQLELSNHYAEKIGAGKNFGKAVKWARMSAEQGNAYAQAMLGLLYLRGHDAETDPGKAAKWIRKSAEQGNVLGESILGLLYQLGKGLPKDMTRAAHWYRKAAKQGDMRSARLLASMYAYGVGVPKDCGLAFYWFEKAASEGSLQARTELQHFGKKGHACYTHPL